MRLHAMLGLLLAVVMSAEASLASPNVREVHPNAQLDPVSHALVTKLKPLQKALVEKEDRIDFHGNLFKNIFDKIAEFFNKFRKKPNSASLGKNAKQDIELKETVSESFRASHDFKLESKATGVSQRITKDQKEELPISFSELATPNNRESLKEISPTELTKNNEAGQSSSVVRTDPASVVVANDNKILESSDKASTKNLGKDSGTDLSDLTKSQTNLHVANSDAANVLKSGTSYVADTSTKLNGKEELHHFNSHVILHPVKENLDENQATVLSKTIPEKQSLLQDDSMLSPSQAILRLIPLGKIQMTADEFIRRTSKLEIDEQIKALVSGFSQDKKTAANFLLKAEDSAAKQNLLVALIRDTTEKNEMKLPDGATLDQKSYKELLNIMKSMGFVT